MKTTINYIKNEKESVLRILSAKNTFFFCWKM